MNITKEQKQFFTLLNAGLWGKDADASLFDASTDWMALFNNAKKQSSIGIVYDGILTLPAEKRPPRGFFLQWTNMVVRIEEDNENLNEELNTLFTFYRNHGLTPVLLKGQGLALHYRNPARRQSGDIDVLVDKDFEKANALLRPESTREEEENAKHTLFCWHNIIVENHKIMSHLSAPGADSFFQKTVASWYPHGLQVKIDGFEVTVPPHEFNAVFLLVHALNHFFWEGLGYKQITDWVRLFHDTQGRFDKALFNHYLKKTGLTRAAKAFGAIAVTYLELPEEALPFSLEAKDFQRGEWMAGHVWEGGNFGFYKTNRKQRPKGYWAGKWFTFTSSLDHCRDFFQLAPAEACWYPFRIAVDSAKMQIKLRRS